MMSTACSVMHVFCSWVFSSDLDVVVSCIMYSVLVRNFCRDIEILGGRVGIW